MRRLRLGIIGCGAVVESGHLPACMQLDNVDLTALVDLSLQQAGMLAHQYSVPIVETDYRAILGKVDAVVIATPPHLHLEQAGFFLSHGVHVLCEKPMANTSVACQQMQKFALQHDAVLSVGHVRRFFFYAEKIKDLIEQGALGRIISICADEGGPYNWPARTAYTFERSLSPGGVMFDLGIHLLDMFYWFQGPIAKIEYGDDAIGGVESNAMAKLEFESGSKGEIRISRTGERPNILEVEGTEGKVQANVYVPDQISLRTAPSKRTKEIRAKKSQSLISAFSDQLYNFVDAINRGQAPRTSGDDGTIGVQLVERCYQQIAKRSLPELAPIPGIIRWH